MSGFKISRETMRKQQKSVKEIRELRQRIYLVISMSPTRKMNATTIAKMVVDDPNDNREVRNTATLVRTMKQNGEIGLTGGKQDGYWSIVRAVGKVKPTYKPTPVTKEEDDAEEPAPQPKAEAEKVVSKTQELINKSIEPMTVSEKPKRITITIEF